MGLAGIASMLQAAAGAGPLTGEQLAAKLESMGASIEASVSQEFTSLNFECLPQDLPEVLALVGSVLQCALPSLYPFVISLRYILSLDPLVVRAVCSPASFPRFVLVFLPLCLYSCRHRRCTESAAGRQCCQRQKGKCNKAQLQNILMTQLQSSCRTF